MSKTKIISGQITMRTPGFQYMKMPMTIEATNIYSEATSDQSAIPDGAVVNNEAEESSIQMAESVWTLLSEDKLNEILAKYTNVYITE